METKQVKEATKSSSIRVPVGLYDWLEQEARRQDRTTHSLMVHALREYMRGRCEPAPRPAQDK